MLIISSKKKHEPDVVMIKTAESTISKTGIPLVPGSDGPINSLKSLKSISNEIGFPLIIKAAAGGGGKGMKVVYNKSELENSYNITKSEGSIENLKSTRQRVVDIIKNSKKNNEKSICFITGVPGARNKLCLWCFS